MLSMETRTHPFTPFSTHEDDDDDDDDDLFSFTPSLCLFLTLKLITFQWFPLNDRFHSCPTAVVNEKKFAQGQVLRAVAKR